MKQRVRKLSWLDLRAFNALATAVKSLDALRASIESQAIAKPPKMGIWLALKESMNAARKLQTNTVFHFTIGRVYQIADLQSVVPRLKTISTRKVGTAFFHLYREKGTHHLWMEGPFKGPGSSGFMYLGPRETKSQFERFLLNEFKSMFLDFMTKSADLFSGGRRRPDSILSEFDQLLLFDLERW